MKTRIGNIQERRKQENWKTGKLGRRKLKTKMKDSGQIGQNREKAETGGKSKGIPTKAEKPIFKAPGNGPLKGMKNGFFFEKTPF